MPEVLITFIVVACIAAIGLWAISKLPADATIVSFIRVAVIVVLAVMLLNVLLVVLFHRNLASFMGS